MSYALAHEPSGDPAATGVPALGPGPVMATGPTVARIRLGAIMQRMRSQAGLSGEDAARAIGGSAPKISKIENGRNAVLTKDVTALLDLYQVTDAQVREEMLALAQLSREDDWYAPLSQNLTVNSRYLLALEAEASLLSVFEQGAVPALLQTDRYARAIAASLNPAGQTWRPADSRNWRGGLGIKVLARRRGLLKLPDPPRLWVLIQRAALTRSPSEDPAVLGSQLAELRTIATSREMQRRITIQIVPDSAGALLSAPGPFTMLKFGHPDVPSMVLTEAMTTIRSSTAPGELDHHRMIFNGLAIEAINPRDTPGVLDQIIGQLPGGSAPAGIPGR